MTLKADPDGWGSIFEFHVDEQLLASVFVDTEYRQNVLSRFVLRASLTLHLYTSSQVWMVRCTELPSSLSQPCGNATLKRWAKPNSSLRFEGDLYESPEMSSAKLNCVILKMGKQRAPKNTDPSKVFVTDSNKS